MEDSPFIGEMNCLERDQIRKRFGFVAPRSLISVQLLSTVLVIVPGGRSYSYP
jgi:hypothetical protein